MIQFLINDKHSTRNYEITILYKKLKKKSNIRLLNMITLKQLPRTCEETKLYFYSFIQFIQSISKF